MLENVIIGQYVSIQSNVHKMDPRAKLICLFLFMIFIFISRHPIALIAGIAIFLMTFLSAKIPLRFYLKGMWFIGLLIAFTFILHVFMTKQGPVLLETPITNIHLGGVTQGGIIATRLLLLIMMASMLTLTTTPVDLTDGMESLLKPLKVVRLPTHELAFMISIALRFIPTLLDETMKIVRAQMARGANFTQGSLMKRARAFIPILVPLFVQAFKRADDLAIAMEARGYAGGEGRTKFRILQWKRLDTVAILIFVLYAVIVIWTKLL